MTTLPQTVRHEQGPARGRHRGTNGHANGHDSANGTSLPALPSMPVLSTPVTMPASAGGSGSGGLTGNDVARVLRENLIWIVLAGILSGVAGFGLNQWLLKEHVSYKAQGQLLAPPEVPFDITGRGESVRPVARENLEVLLQTQVAGLKNPELLMEVLEDNSEVRNSSWLRKEAGMDEASTINSQIAVEKMLENFNASPLKGSRLINVSFEADNAQDATNILRVITNTRMREVEELSSRDLDLEIRELGRLIGQRQERLDDIDRQIRAVRTDGGGADDMAATRTVVQGELGQLIRARGEAEASAAEFRQALESAQDAISRGNDPPMVNAQVAQDPKLLRLEAQIDNIRQLLAINEQKLGEGHTFIEALREQLDALTNLRADTEADARARARDGLIAQLQTQLELFEEQAEQANVEIERFDSRLKQLERDAAELSLLTQDRMAKSAELEANRTRLSLLERQSFVRPQQQLQWYVQPVPPTSPDFPRLPLTVAFCMLLGVGSVVGLAFLREVLDTTVKSPRDVVRGGDMTVLGTIPDESDDPEATSDGNPLSLAIAHSPHSMTAEQYRMVRSRLAHVAPLETTRSILVTSPQPGDGKTTVACNLAAGLALNGRSVLLIDANFRRSALHEVFGLDNEVGFSTALVDPDRFDECVATVENVPNLHVLPAGPKPDKSAATELIEGNGFLDVIDHAYEQYDVVVFDSGPILFTSETGALAPQVDGVISVVRARSSTRGLLGRLRDSLASLNVEHLGVVLNAVRSRAGGYYTRNIKTFYDYQNVPARR
ncbi:MAG: AAA family ATPase [Planctomycetota bacterium]